MRLNNQTARRAWRQREWWRGLRFAGLLVLITVLWGCLPRVPYEPTDNYRQVARSMGQQLAQALRQDLALKGKGFIIVPARNNLVQQEIDGLTEDFRQELRDTLLRARVNLQTRYPLHGPFQPQRLEHVYCGRDSTDISLYIMLEIEPLDATYARVVLKAYDLKASKLMSFRLEETFELSYDARQQLARTRVDTALEGTDLLPFDDRVKDKVAKYIGYNFACIAELIDTGQEVCVTGQASLTPFEKDVWDIAKNYIGMYKPIAFVPTTTPSSAPGCFPLEIKGYQDKGFRVLWVTGPERFSVRVYHRDVRSQARQAEAVALAAHPLGKAADALTRSLEQSLIVPAEPPLPVRIQDFADLDARVPRLGATLAEYLQLALHRSSQFTVQTATQSDDVQAKARPARVLGTLLMRGETVGVSARLEKDGRIIATGYTQVPKAELVPGLFEIVEVLPHRGAYQLVEGLLREGDGQGVGSLQVSTGQTVYRQGELLTLYVRTAVDGYLSLIGVGTSGQATILYPNTFSPARLMRAGQLYTIPAQHDAFVFEVSGPPGVERIKAVITTPPLSFQTLPVKQGFRRIDPALPTAARDLTPLLETLKAEVLAQDVVQFRVLE